MQELCFFNSNTLKKGSFNDLMNKQRRNFWFSSCLFKKNHSVAVYIIKLFYFLIFEFNKKKIVINNSKTTNQGV